MYSRKYIEPRCEDVDQLKNKNDIVCTDEDIKSRDDSDVYGQTRGDQHVCTVCPVETVAYRCVDSVGSNAIG